MDTKDYMELGLKRMILWASENGFEKIAWTTGEQQMKRYNLSKHVNKITYMPPEPGSDMYFTGAEDKNGNMIRGYKADGTLDELAEIYGTDIAEKMRKGEGTPNPEDPKQIDLTGVDLDITDPNHFLNIAYDKVLKNAAQKLGKKYDAKVGVGELFQPDEIRFDYIYEDGETFFFRPMGGDSDNYALMTRNPNGSTSELITDFRSIKEGEEYLNTEFGSNYKKKSMGDDQVWTLNLSEKLKSAAEKGLPYMAVVPPAAMMMNQEQDRTPINRAAARPIMENYAN
jgi:hypothetical protein